MKITNEQEAYIALSDFVTDFICSRPGGNWLGDHQAAISAFNAHCKSEGLPWKASLSQKVKGDTILYSNSIARI